MTYPDMGLPHPDIRLLINAGKVILQEIIRHPDLLALNYQPDVTISDAHSALIYLENELNSRQL